MTRLNLLKRAKIKLSTLTKTESAWVHELCGHTVKKPHHTDTDTHFVSVQLCVCVCNWPVSYCLQVCVQVHINNCVCVHVGLSAPLGWYLLYQQGVRVAWWSKGPIMENSIGYRFGLVLHVWEREKEKDVWTLFVCGCYSCCGDTDLLSLSCF